MKKIITNGKSVKIRAELEVVKIYEYVTEPYHYYDSGVRRLYIFKDEEGQEYVYRTSRNFLVAGHFEDNMKGAEDWVVDWAVNVGGRIILKGSIKGEKEYNGKPQIQLTRCEVLSVLDEGPTPEELHERKKIEQKNSITVQDSVIRVSYKEYKEKYNNCETIIDSFERTPNGCFIEVIVRNN